ncbi:MAG: branched-chain amino acid ABC transporter permease [Actinomycetota bacterium]
MATASEAVPAAPTVSSPARWRPSARGWAIRIAILAALGVGFLYLLITVEPLWADRISLAAIYVIIGLSLNIVLGYTGQVSLGHHAFVGLAAFVAAHHLTVRAGCLPEEGCTESSLTAFFVAIAVGTLSGVLSAGLLGLVALRIKGLYLALITLTYGFVAVDGLFEIPFLTRGGAGMPAPRPSAFVSDHRYMTLCLAFVAVVMFIDWRLLKSKMGRAVLAVKESEAVAASYAVNVTVYKVLAFMLSGAFAGLAGALFASRRQIVVAADFNFQTALLWVLMVVVGGLGSRFGVLIGSAFFALFPFLIQLIGPLNHFVESTLQRDPEEFTLVVGPLLALLTMISFPGGIAEQLSPITRWLTGHKFTMHPDGKHKAEGHSLLARFRKHKTEPEDEVTASGRALHTENGGEGSAQSGATPDAPTEKIESAKEGR